MNPVSSYSKTSLVLLAILFFGSCQRMPEEKDHYEWVPLQVTATAFNSVPWQTSYEHPDITAWGDSLKPGMKTIAVSRDLIAKGLIHNTPVRIEGFEGVYLVKDKMHHKWQNRIDIYMGEDVEKAKEWGRKKVNIEYAVKKQNQKTKTN